MKILQLSTSLQGGAGIAAKRLNEALNSIGANSNIYALGKNSLSLKESEYLIERISTKTIKSKINTFIQYRFVQNSSNLITTSSISTLDVNKFDFTEYDVIHLHAVYNLLNDKDLFNLFDTNKKIFITLHDQRLFTGGCHYSKSCAKYRDICDECPQVHKIFRNMVKTNLQFRVDRISFLKNVKIVSPSKWLAELAQSSRLLEKNKIEIINNPIPIIFASQDFMANRAEFDYKENEIVITFIAADLSNPNKGLQTLLEALKKIDTVRMKHLKLVLIGKNAPILILEHIKNVIVPDGSESTIAKRLSASDLVVVPSIIDNSPNVIGEALMSGVKVFSSRVGGNCEILEHFDLPSFDCDNSEQLSKLIIDFNKNYDREEIRKKAQTFFDYQTIGHKMLSLYST